MCHYVSDKAGFSLKVHQKRLAGGFPRPAGELLYNAPQIPKLDLRGEGRDKGRGRRKTYIRGRGQTREETGEGGEGPGERGRGKGHLAPWSFLKVGAYGRRLSRRRHLSVAPLGLPVPSRVFH